MFRNRRLVAFAMVWCGAQGAVLAEPIVATWASREGGHWSDAANWSTAPHYPNNGSPASDSEYIVNLGVGAVPIPPDRGLIRLDTDVTVNFLDTRGSVFYHSSGTLRVLDTLWISATGDFQLRGGTISQTTIRSDTLPPPLSERFTLSREHSTMENVKIETVRMDVRNGAHLTFRDGFETNSGVQVWDQSALHFAGTQTFRDGWIGLMSAAA